MLTGFIDETEKHEGKRLTGVGGFLFRKEALSALQTEIAARTRGLSKPLQRTAIHRKANFTDGIMTNAKLYCAILLE